MFHINGVNVLAVVEPHISTLSEQTNLNKNIALSIKMGTKSYKKLQILNIVVWDIVMFWITITWEHYGK